MIIQNNNPLRVIPVEGRRSLRHFIRIPWSIYAHDPAWVPPLLIERHEHLSPRNPYFEHAQFCSWIAYRGNRPVGRISAQVDELHIQRYQDATGFFGMLEAEDNAETFQVLMDAAERWLSDKGIRRVERHWVYGCRHDTVDSCWPANPEMLEKLDGLKHLTLPHQYIVLFLSCVCSLRQR